MQVFVTGGTGFVGGYVLRELVARGHQIRALVRDAQRLEGIADLIDQVVPGDLHDTAALACGARGADAVIHVAGLLAENHADAFEHVNVVGTQNVLQAAADAGSVRRFVQISSIAAAGPSRPGHPLDETMPAEPVSDYGRSKLAAEAAVEGFADRFEVSIVRPPIVYGPGDASTFVFFKMVQQGAVFSIASPEAQVSLVYAGDLAHGIVLATELPAAAGECFYFADRARPRVKELVRAIEEALDTRARLKRVPTPVAWGLATLSEGWGRLSSKPMMLNRDKVREMVAPGWACSALKATHLLGWQPEVNFHAGMRRAAEWYRERGWLRAA